MTASLAPGLYSFDDLAVGDRIETGSSLVSAEVVDGFAALTGDRFEIHMTEAGAARHGFPARVAHGLLILSLVDGLKNQCPAQIRALASLDWEWGFTRPVFVDDTIRVQMTVEAKRDTRKPAQGVLTIGFVVFNQQGQAVQSGRNRLLAYRS